MLNSNGDRYSFAPHIVLEPTVAYRQRNWSELPSSFSGLVVRLPLSDQSDSFPSIDLLCE